MIQYNIKGVTSIYDLFVPQPLVMQLNPKMELKYGFLHLIQIEWK